MQHIHRDRQIDTSTYTEKLAKIMITLKVDEERKKKHNKLLTRNFQYFFVSLFQCIFMFCLFFSIVCLVGASVHILLAIYIELHSIDKQI